MTDQIDALADEYGEQTKEAQTFEEAGIERPEWLPEKFRSPEDLVRSYREAENKIREQGSELKSYRDQLSEYELALMSASEVGAPDRAAELQQMQEQAMLAHGQPVQPQGPTPELIAEQGIAVAASQLGAEAVGKAVDLFRTDPQWAAYFAQTVNNGPAAVVEGIGEAVKAIDSQRRDTRDMKLNAQGISGGQSGRPDPVSTEQQAWQRIANVNMGSYSDLMRGR
jgi:hypothetical protein